MKLNQILCGVDFSEESIRAFETAAELDHDGVIFRCVGVPLDLYAEGHGVC